MLPRYSAKMDWQKEPETSQTEFPLIPYHPRNFNFPKWSFRKKVVANRAIVHHR